MRKKLDRLMERYTGWAKLKEEVFPTDARRGWFTGLDGRRIRIPLAPRKEPANISACLAICRQAKR